MKEIDLTNYLLPDEVLADIAEFRQQCEAICDTYGLSYQEIKCGGQVEDGALLLRISVPKSPSPCVMVLVVLRPDWGLRLSAQAVDYEISRFLELLGA